jgi:hypothetical protein
MSDPRDSATDAPSSGASLLQENLFAVPIWSASVPQDSQWIPLLVSDIDDILDSGLGMDSQECSGHQTKPELQDRAASHWLSFFQFVNETFEAITSTAGQLRWPRHGIRAWALRIDERSVQKDLERGAARTLLTHNHSPALLTSVFTCELPPSLRGDQLSTVFYNPAAHMVCPWQQRTALVAPEVGTLTVFPGWIEHAAPLVVPLSEGERRVIISIDYFPEIEGAT